MADHTTGTDCNIDESAILGYGDFSEPTRIGDDARVRAGSILYGNVTIGDRFQTGHDTIVREDTTIGNDVLVGTKAILDGDCTVGSRVSIQSRAYVPQRTAIGDDVFLGPAVALTNDPYPIRRESRLEGPHLADGVSIGANATVLPGVSIGAESFVAAAAVVTEDVPERRLAVGAPASIRPLPPELAAPNDIT